MRLEQLMPLIRETLNAGKTVRFSPRGISMLPMLRQGIDSVVLSPLPEKLRKYDLPLYQRDDGHYVLHRIVQTGENYTCIGDNQFALVTAFTRGEREIPVTALAYRVYCRCWHYSRGLRHLWRRGKGWLRRHLK